MKSNDNFKSSKSYNFQHANNQVSICYNCQTNENIIHDKHHDIIYCDNCGTVLRENLEDHTPLEYAIFPVMSIEHKNWKAKQLNDKISNSMDRNK